MRRETHRTRRVGALLAVVFLGLAGIAACGSDSPDTGVSAGATTSEGTTSSTAEDQSGQGDVEESDETTTAVTTGQAVMTDVTLDLETGQPDPTAVPSWEIEVTMDDGSTRMIPVDEDIMMNEIWPDGTTSEGVRVTIELVDGEERITGRAE